MLNIFSWIFNWRKVTIWFRGPKNHTRKIYRIHKDFGLTQVYLHDFMCKNVWIFMLYVLLKRTINRFWSIRVLTNRNIMRHLKTCYNSKIFVNFVNFSFVIFEFKLFRYLQIIYCRHALTAFLPLRPTFPTTLPQLCQLFSTSQLYTNFYQ